MSCASELSHKYYMQNTQLVPQFKEKNEFRLSGNLSTGEKIIGSNIQSAYSITSKFAFMASYQNFKNSQSSSINGVSTGSYKGQYLDGAAGYYKDLKKYGIFDVYAGFGTGYQNHSYAEITNEIVIIYFLFSPIQTVVSKANLAGYCNLNYNKLYIQPSYGFSFKYIEMALSTRLSALNFYKVDDHINSSNLFSGKSDIVSIQKNRNYVLFEPCITLRTGWDLIKFQLQYGYSGVLTNHYFPFTDSYFSIGLNFALAKRFRKDKPKENS